MSNLTAPIPKVNILRELRPQRLLFTVKYILENNYLKRFH